MAHGGGANSNGLLVAAFRRGFRPDLILMGDTGGEKPATYAGVAVTNGWLARRDWPLITLVTKTYQGRPETLENDCLRKHMLPSVAYGFKSCSQKFKREPQDKFCNNWEPARAVWERGEKVIKWIGYDADEPQRAHIASDNKYTYQYPLIEWGLGRDECIALCKSESLPFSKSACFFCPNAKKHEILSLDSSLQERAIALESNAETTTVVGLGRRFAWADLIRADRAQQRLFPDSYEEMPCGCYDGGGEDE